MKKSVFTLIAIAFVLFANVTVANAQMRVITAPTSYNYNHVRDNVNKGDEEYRRGAYTTAVFYYECALRDNGQCGDNKYISDAELNRKLDDCQYAIKHNGQTRSDCEKAETKAAVENLVNALVGAFSKKK